MDKNKALEGAISQIEKAFGKGSIMKLGKKDNNSDIDDNYNCDTYEIDD